MSRDKSRIVYCSNVLVRKKNKKDPPRSLRRSVSVSLAATYLHTCGCTNKARVAFFRAPGTSLESSSAERSVRTHTHKCVIILSRRARDKWSRSRSRSRGKTNLRVANFQGKKTVLGGVARLSNVFDLFFSRRRDDENPRENRTREMREYFITCDFLYVESGDRQRRSISFTFFYLSFYSISVDRQLSSFISDADQFAVRPHLLCDPFFFSASSLRDGVWATPFFLSMVLARIERVYISPFSERLILFERIIYRRKIYFSAEREIF